MIVSSHLPARLDAHLSEDGRDLSLPLFSPQTLSAMRLCEEQKGADPAHFKFLVVSDLSRIETARARAVTSALVHPV